LGKGTGLGLSTVYGIVKQSDGYIWVSSEVGEGASFKIYLPRVFEATEAPMPHAAAKEDAVVAGAESNTVLLVEDESGIRELTSELLASWGYEVLVARNGVEALEISVKQRGGMHWMITEL